MAADRIAAIPATHSHHRTSGTTPHRCPAGGATARRRCTASSSGQSVPISRTCSLTADARRAAAAMRTPRSPVACSVQQTPSSGAKPCQAGSDGCGVTQSSTGPTAAALASCSVCSNMRRASRAAVSAPSAGIRRVFANPATGAFAKTTIRVTVNGSVSRDPRVTRRASNPGAAATSGRSCARRPVPPTCAPTSAPVAGCTPDVTAGAGDA